MSDSIRTSIYSRLDRLWAWDNYSTSRWLPIKNRIIRQATGLDVTTKAGRKAIREFKLNSKECTDIVQAMSDGDLLDLYELSAQRSSMQM